LAGSTKLSISRLALIARKLTRYTWI